MTSAKLAMIDLGLTGGEAAIADMARAKEGPFVRGIVGSPWSGVINELCRGTAKPIGRETLFAALEAAGWRDLGRLHSSEHQSPKHAWSAPDMADKPRAVLRALLEGPPGLTVVK